MINEQPRCKQSRYHICNTIYFSQQAAGNPAAISTELISTHIVELKLLWLENKYTKYVLLNNMG